jgi:sec-independent protein translocase protein TatA
MGEFSLTHLLLLSIIFLIFFGPSRLPQLGQSLGKAIRGFKQGLNEIDVDAKDIQDNRPQQQVNHQQQQQMPHQQTQFNQTQDVTPEQKVTKSDS